ncbi:TPA: hypothetical protein JC740_001688 [Salmonella enterica subsp. diarizonae]|nr:hypothetical protein [Salmonella enterica subsp. diarizonae]
MTGNLFLKGDARLHFAIANEDGNVRMWLYKDKGGDGVRINNGIDGGGEFIFGKDNQFYSPGDIRAGSARFAAADSDIYGTCWGGWLSTWLNNQFNTRATMAWVRQYFVQDIRQSGIMSLSVGTNANTQTPEGGVVIGAIVHGNWDNNEELKYTWLQKNINGTWLTVGRV